MTKEFNPKKNPASSIAVSIGEPAGIGPDIILDAWSKRASLNAPHFTLIGDGAVIQQRCEILGLNVPLQQVSNGSQAVACDDQLPIIPLDQAMDCSTGIANGQNSAGVIEAIERGVKMVMAGEFSALTTCPINKKILYDAGFEFPGHTEYLADLAETITGASCRPVMMLASAQLRAIPITIHIALHRVKDVLDQQVILETARIAANDLRDKFGIANPVLAIAGLNPHAGEGGAMGREEIDIIIPAIKTLQNEGINAIGPLPADTMFHQRARQNYDVALCMYHDQALIPAKTLAFDEAVNVTLGLPFIRTSPDHGTAFDIAGSGKANSSSFVAALKMADDMAKTSQHSSKHQEQSN